MKNLISRERALKNEVFASFIGTWQKRFDPRQDPYMTGAGNYYDSEVDKERFYSQKEVDLINEQELDEFLQKQDNVEIGEFVNFGELKYNLRYTDIEVYSIEIGKIMEKLSSFFESELIFLLDYKIPWLWQKNDYEPVRKALNYLKDIGTTEEFIGGYKQKRQRPSAVYNKSILDNSM